MNGTLPYRECTFLADGGADALVTAKDSSSRGRLEPVEDYGVGPLAGMATAGLGGSFVSEVPAAGPVAVVAFVDGFCSFAGSSGFAAGLDLGI